MWVQSIAVIVESYAGVITETILLISVIVAIIKIDKPTFGLSMFKEKEIKT